MVPALAVTVGLLMQAAAGGAPQLVRVWRADSMLYVELSKPGHLLLMHVDAIGRIDILFPLVPNEGTGMPGDSTLAVFLPPAAEGNPATFVAVRSRWPFNFTILRAGSDWNYYDAWLLQPTAGDPIAALLDIAAHHAESAGTRVVRAVGAEFEAEVSFSGLSHVLHPLLDGLAVLPPLHRQALSVALGLDAGAPADRLVVSNAVLGLLRDASASRPLLVVVDDLPWLDRASSLVLASAVRRLAGTRVGFLAALRTEAESFFDRAAGELG